MSEQNTPETIDLNVRVGGAPASPPAGLVPFKNTDGEDGGLELMSRFATDITPDMVATKMAAEVEKAIRIKLSDARKEADIKSKELRALEKQRSDRLLALPKELLGDLAARFVAAVAPFDITGEAEYGAAAYDKVNATVTIPFTMKFGNHLQSVVERKKVFPAPDDLVALQTSIEAKSIEVSDANALVRKVNSALLNISTIEREAKANVIERIMSSSEAGQRTLDHMRASIDVDRSVEYLQSV